MTTCNALCVGGPGLNTGGTITGAVIVAGGSNTTVGNKIFAVSYNGINWRNCTSDTGVFGSLSTRTCNVIASTSDTFIAGGNISSAPNTLPMAYSTDGLTWTNMPANGISNASFTACSSDSD